MSHTHRRKRRRLRPQIVLLLLCIAVTVIFAAAIGIYKGIDRDTPDTPDIPVSSDDKDTVTPSPSSDDTPDTPDEPVSPQETRISFIAAGDNLIHQAIIDDAKRLANERGLGERYYFDSMYEDFKKAFSSADISFINQETMISGDEFAHAGYPHFNTPSEMGETLERLGIDVVNIASNHSLDLYGKGLSNCINYFKDSPIVAIGAYENYNDYNTIRVIEKEGIKIAFLSYTYGTNEYVKGNGYENLVVANIDFSEMERQVKEAHSLADLVFVSMHWGTEGSFDISSHQKSAAQVLVDAGADVIIGHHPHTIQEMKWKDRPDGKKTLIAYSLGNFISTMHPAYNMLGGLMSFDIVKNDSGISIENPLFTPTMCHYSLTRDSLHMYYLENYSQELYEKHGTTLQIGGWSYDRMIKTVKETIPEEFLQDWIINYK